MYNFLEALLGQLVQIYSRKQVCEHILQFPDIGIKCMEGKCGWAHPSDLRIQIFLPGVSAFNTHKRQDILH